jgi:hypothetical protein
MIKLHILFPILLDMTLVTFLPFLALVHIIVFMTVDAPRLQLVLAQISPMAVVAGKFQVRPHYLELRVFIMIEGNLEPHSRLVTLLTLPSKTALVDVVALVASRACHRSILESRRQMTVLTSRRCMTAR